MFVPVTWGVPVGGVEVEVSQHDEGLATINEVGVLKERKERVDGRETGGGVVDVYDGELVLRVKWVSDRNDGNVGEGGGDGSVDFGIDVVVDEDC